VVRRHGVRSFASSGRRWNDSKIHLIELIVKVQNRFNSLILQLFELAKMLFIQYRFQAQCVHHSVYTCFRSSYVTQFRSYWEVCGEFFSHFCCFICSSCTALKVLVLILPSRIKYMPEVWIYKKFICATISLAKFVMRAFPWHMGPWFSDWGATQDPNYCSWLSHDIFPTILLLLSLFLVPLHPNRWSL
jgi:hypothetical protein